MSAIEEGSEGLLKSQGTLPATAQGEGLQAPPTPGGEAEPARSGLPAETAVETRQAGAQIARAAAIIMAAFIVSNLVGFVQTLVISRAFGTSAQLDSFNAANRVTELLFNLMAGGALGSAFIPLFTGLLTRGERKRAWELASGVLNVLLAVLIVVTVLIYIFAPWLVQHGLFLLVPNSDPVQLELTVRLLRIMLPTVVIFGVSGLLMGMLNSHQSFLIPAIAPILYSGGIIFGTLALPTTLGIDRVAYGVLIGASAHLLVQLPAIWRLPQRAYTRTAGLRDKLVRQVLTLMVPRLIGAGVVQLNFVANTVIALSLGEGAASAVALAFTLMLMPQRTIAQSAGIASLPTLSAQAELGEFAAMRKTLSDILRVIMLLALPSTVGLILIRQVLVQVLYQRGAFTAHSTEMVAWALLWYAIGLVGHSLVEVLSRAFYALHDTRTPVMVSVGAMALNIGLSFAFASLFARLGWMSLGGLALANSVATTLESLVLLILLRTRMRGIGGSRVWNASLIGLLGSALMGAGVWAWLNFATGNSQVVLLLGALVIGVGLYAGLMLLLKVPEAHALVNKIKARVVARR